MRNWREDTLAWSRWVEIHLVSWQIETGDQPLVDPGQLHLHSHFLLSTLHCWHIGGPWTDGHIGEQWRGQLVHPVGLWTETQLTYRNCLTVVSCEADLDVWNYYCLIFTDCSITEIAVWWLVWAVMLSWCLVPARWGQFLCNITSR